MGLFRLLHLVPGGKYDIDVTYTNTIIRASRDIFSREIFLSSVGIPVAQH
jgi:hypothetical protein